MNLRLKTLIITGAMSAVIMLVIYGILYDNLYQNFTALEQKNVMNLVHDANAHIVDDAVQLDVALGDWALWDDTYRFIDDKNNAYVKSNLEDASLAAAQIHMMAFYDEEGRTVLVKMVKTGDAPVANVPAELSTLSQDSLLLKNGNGSARGIMALGGRLAIVASRPILTSKAEGPRRGTILMARYISKENIATLAGARGTATGMWLLGETMPEDCQSAADSIFASGDAMLIRPINDTSVAGYFIAKDVHDRPVAIFKVERQRDEYAEFGKNALYMLAIIFVAAEVFEALIFVLLDMIVLSRLKRLGEQADHVGKPNGSVENIVPDRDGDEITHLAVDMNRMLARLRSTQGELLRSQISYSRRLHADVKRKTRQLSSANEKLHSMEKTKNQFLVNIGHELKSPLAVIEMNLEAAKNTGIAKKRREESRKMIARNMERLKQKIDEIIQLSRFEYGKDVQKGEMDFADLVKEVVRKYQDFADVNGAKIHLEMDGQRMAVMGDRRLLQYALGNLLSNAVKYCDDKKISVKVARKGGLVVFSIANRGRGVKPENRKKLFRKFFKEDQTSIGTGVGLYMTREIAKGHSGNVWYEPNKPSGAIFHFSIPAMDKGGVG